MSNECLWLRQGVYAVSIAVFFQCVSIPDVFAQESMEVVHVSAHRVEQDINEIPASVTVIDQQQLTQRQPFSLSDLFRYEPGITVDQSGSRHGDANITIRGIGGNRVLILQDGVRMPSGFGSAGVDQGRGNFNAFNLERVEVLKGPSSALYGSDAIGGVVLLESLNAERLVQENNGDSVMRLFSSVASTDERYRAGLTYAAGLGSGYALVQTEHQRFAEEEPNSAFKPNPKQGEVNSVLAKWSLTTDNDQHWDFIGNIWQQKTDNELLTNLGPVSGPPGTQVTQSDASDDSKRWHLGVHYSAKHLLGFDQLHAQLDYQQSNYKQFEQETQENPGSVFPPIPASKQRTLENESFEQDQWSLALRGQKSWASHAIVTGLDVMKKAFTRPVDRTYVNDVTGTTSKTSAGVTYPGKTFPDTDIEQLGIYLQDNWKISEQWKLLAGVRYDYFSSDPKADQAYQNFNPSGAEVDARSDDRLSPHIGLTFSISDNQQLYTNYATGFRAPPVDDQFISRAILIPVPGVPHEVVPNTELEAESSEGYELGWRWQNSAASVRIAYYEARYKDFIDTRTIGFRSQPPVFVGPTAIRQIQYQNVDKVEISGLELHSAVILDTWMPMNWQSKAQLAINIIDAENRDTGNGLNSVGPNSAVVGLSSNNPQASLGFGWHLRIAEAAKDAEPLTRHGQVLSSFEPPGYAVHDVNIFWAPNNRLRVDGAIYNVFDKKYWSSHTKGDNANGNLDASVEPGRNIAVTVRYSF